MDFDSTIFKLSQNGKRIDYGIMQGNEKIVFIKSGAGSDYKGYQDKYVKMALRLHARGGYTVISASNPGTNESTFDVDKAVIEEYIIERGFKKYELNLVGASNGAYQNVFLANQLNNVKKTLNINMPLMINFQKAMSMLLKLGETEKIFVYGTADPSADYIPFLETMKMPNFKVVCINGADHQFIGMLDEFIALSDLI